MPNATHMRTVIVNPNKIPVVPFQNRTIYNYVKMFQTAGSILDSEQNMKTIY
jgi:hypothetical protein